MDIQVSKFNILRILMSFVRIASINVIVPVVIKNAYVI